MEDALNSDFSDEQETIRRDISLLRHEVQEHAKGVQRVYDSLEDIRKMLELDYVREFISIVQSIEDDSIASIIQLSRERIVELRLINSMLNIKLNKE